MDTDKNKELTARLKSKRRRKYILMVLAIMIGISAVKGLSIESRDSRLPDGQGNMVAVQPAGDPDQTAEEEGKKETESDSASENCENSESDMNSADSAEKPTEKQTTEQQTENPSQRTDDEKEIIDPPDVKVDNSEDFTASNGGNAALKPKEPKPVTVTLEIRCDTISSDMSKLENTAIKDYIPADGTILEKAIYRGTTDNTVFDVLNTLCRNNGIQLEFSYTPVYESYYIEGINYLYEFDGGNQSGWMYKVNGWFPNYGCSSYYLSDGDVIEWVYTCNLGKDVEDNSME